MAWQRHGIGRPRPLLGPGTPMLAYFSSVYDPDDKIPGQSQTVSQMDLTLDIQALTTIVSSLF